MDEKVRVVLYTRESWRPVGSFRSTPQGETHRSYMRFKVEVNQADVFYPGQPNKNVYYWIEWD